MQENESDPYLLACLPLEQKFAHLQKIAITSEDFKLGRGLVNSACIPHLAISRKHCTFKKIGENEWCIEDHSTAGIKINNIVLGKGSKRKLEHEDLIVLEPSGELYYKFVLPAIDMFEIPRKRMKMDNSSDRTILNNVKLKFEESQKCEMQHIEDKIQNAKQMQTNTMTLKKKLQEDMDRKIQALEKEFSVQIENLKGEKHEVEMQKASLIEERDIQLTKVKEEMQAKISDLMELINKQRDTESELLRENSSLKEKLEKEREDFLSELNRESTSKQDMLEKLEAKIREQEEVRLKERQELENALRQETEQLRLAKEKELEEMAELKRQREIEHQLELTSIKENLAKQVEQTEQQRVKAEMELKVQMEQMIKLKEEEKVKMEQLQKEREEIQRKLTEAQNDAEKSKIEIQARVVERETELAALAAERIQKQVDQSSEVISTLQQQLEKVKSQLQTVESEKNTLLENICTDPPGEGTSKADTLNEFGELMESELQCSICAELFVEATTLKCSHTFCKYCITMWKKKKKDCPICRTPIASECKSLVLDSFIERMVQNLTEEMKKKRQDMLAFRAELEAQALLPSIAVQTSRGGSGIEINDYELEEEEDYYGQDANHQHAEYVLVGRPGRFGSDADSGSDNAADSDDPGTGADADAAPTGSNTPSNSERSRSHIGSEILSDGRTGDDRPDRSPTDIDSGWADAFEADGSVEDEIPCSPDDTEREIPDSESGRISESNETGERESERDRSGATSPGDDGTERYASDDDQSDEQELSDRVRPDAYASDVNDPEEYRSDDDQPEEYRSYADQPEEYRSDDDPSSSDLYSWGPPHEYSSDDDGPQEYRSDDRPEDYSSDDDGPVEYGSGDDEPEGNASNDGTERETSEDDGDQRYASEDDGHGRETSEDDGNEGETSEDDRHEGEASEDDRHEGEASDARSRDASDSSESCENNTVITGFSDRVEVSDAATNESEASYRTQWSESEKSRTETSGEGAGGGGRRRRRGHIPGVEGTYYGGYGRCFACGARGHWAHGCPFR